MPTPFSILVPDAELRAFIFQQSQDLENLAANIRELTFLLEESSPKNRTPNFRVTLKLSIDESDIVVQSESDNVYSALIEVKEDARMHIEAILIGLDFGADGNPILSTQLQKQIVH